MDGDCERFKKVYTKPSFIYKIRREPSGVKKLNKTHIQGKTENEYNQIEIFTK